MYIYSFLINGKVKPLFLNNLLLQHGIKSLIFLGVFSYFFFPLSSMASGASFSSTNNPITIQNSQDPQDSLLTINLSNITKLSSINYLIWSLQIQSLLEGYDLYHFIDDAHTPPPPTVTITCVASLNPAYTTWKRQNRLIFNALLGAIFVSLQSLIVCTTASLDVWQTLVNTYAKPLIIFSPPMVYPILLHYIYLNTMVFPNDVIVILLKPIYLFSLMHQYL